MVGALGSEACARWGARWIQERVAPQCSFAALLW